MMEPCPCVKCERDGAPMYLSEYLPERPSLRLWKCPLCKTVRANGEVSVGSQEEPPQKGITLSPSTPRAANAS